MKTNKPSGEYQGRKKSGSEAAARQKQDGRSTAAPLEDNHDKPNAALVWKQFEDLLTTRVLVSPIEHATYSYLLRRSFLEGERSARFSIRELARHVRASDKATRKAVRRLASQGVLRLVERSKAGHLAEEATRIATWCPAVWSAIRRKEKRRPRCSSADCAAKAG